jgi:hypothetical protein
MFTTRNLHHTTLSKWPNILQNGPPLTLLGVFPQLPFLDPLMNFFAVKLSL